MKRQHKKYDVPMKKWDSTRLQREDEIMKKFGLKNKRQLWKARSMLRRFRSSAKRLFSQESEAAEVRAKELLGKLARYGLLPEKAELDDVLPMTVEQILARQLQFIVKSKGLASSPKQARQLIVHGHIAVGDHKVTRPSYMVSEAEEKEVKYAPTSPISMPGHPIREIPKASLKSETEKALAEIKERKLAEEKKDSKAEPGKEEKEEKKEKGGKGKSKEKKEKEGGKEKTKKEGSEPGKAKGEEGGKEKAEKKSESKAGKKEEKTEKKSESKKKGGKKGKEKAEEKKKKAEGKEAKK